MSTVAVVDYGMGNLRSVAKAIEHVAPEASVHSVTAQISPSRIRVDNGAGSPCAKLSNSANATKS